MSTRTDLIRQQESRTQSDGRSIRLLSLPLALLFIFAAGIFIREKLVAHDSVQELESFVKQANGEDQFTFFKTLPDLKMKSGMRMHPSTVIPQNHQPPAPSKDHDRPKADVNRADTAPVHSRGITRPSGEGYTIQVAALRMQAEAEKIIRSLKTKGYSAYLVKDGSNSGEDSWYRVRIGRFSGRPEAEKHLHELSERAGVRGFVIASMGSGAGL